MENTNNTVAPAEISESAYLQCRKKSCLFWVGMGSAAINALISAAISSEVHLPWWVGAIGLILSALLAYCNGNNPSIAGKY